MSTVFYAWQSDQPNNTNRGVIKDALQSAIQTLNERLIVEESLEFDSDTQNVSGSPALAKVMPHYPATARRHSMYVIMADCVGPSDKFVSVGQSAVWNRRGELIAQMDAASEGVVVFPRGDNGVVLDTVTGCASLHALTVAGNRSLRTPKLNTVPRTEVRLGLPFQLCGDPQW
jgi:hypothetical protein